MSEAPNSTQYYNYVYLDDVVVDYAPECGPVNNIHSTVSVTSALIGWTPSLRGESLGGTIEYRDITDSLGSWNEATTSTNLIALTNLDPATTYEARIYNTCDDGNSPYVYYTFHIGLHLHPAGHHHAGHRHHRWRNLHQHLPAYLLLLPIRHVAADISC